jgi:hypothetical protein
MRPERCPAVVARGGNCRHAIKRGAKDWGSGSPDRQARDIVAEALGRNLTDEEMVHLASSEVWHALRKLVLQRKPVALPDLSGDVDTAGGPEIEAWLAAAIADDTQVPA